MLRKELLDLLCCPGCKGDLDYSSEKETLTCRLCGKVYEVKDGIPIMMSDDHIRGFPDSTCWQKRQIAPCRSLGVSGSSLAFSVK